MCLVHFGVWDGPSAVTIVPIGTSEAVGLIAPMSPAPFGVLALSGATASAVGGGCTGMVVG